MLTAGVLMTLGMFSCIEETTSIKENIEVEKITDVVDKVVEVDTIIVVNDTVHADSVETNSIEK